MKPDSVRIRTREEFYDVFTANHNKKPTFPMAFISYGNVSPSNRMRSQVPARGRAGPHERDKADPWATSFIPLAMGMTLEFHTDDYLRALKFISDRYYMSEFAMLDFDLEYRDVPLSIQTVIDPDTTVPQKSRISSDVSHFAFQVTFTVHGFVSSDGGKYDQRMGKGQRILFQAKLGDETGELLVQKEIVVKHPG